MLKTVALSLAVLLVVAIGGVLAYAATKPDVFRLQRATTIQAPPETVFALIDDFHRWRAWSPWEEKDPALERSYSEPARGLGATYAWKGNKDVGQGRMRIAESAAPARILLNLDFEKPFEAHNMVEFALEPVADGTRVTWTMHGPTPYFAKLIHVFLDMDKMVGKDFESGLAKMKAAAEAQAR
jgi:uncharacterized protein YndB with AHSA1/START domain